MVLDRLFLWIFSVACVMGTAMIILQAPSLYDNTRPIDIQYSKIAKKKLMLMMMGPEEEWPCELTINQCGRSSSAFTSLSLVLRLTVGSRGPGRSFPRRHRRSDTQAVLPSVGLSEFYAATSCRFRSRVSCVVVDVALLLFIRMNWNKRDLSKVCSR